MFVFSENLACFIFLKHPFRDPPLCLITDEILYKIKNCKVIKSPGHHVVGVTSSFLKGNAPVEAIFHIGNLVAVERTLN